MDVIFKIIAIGLITCLATIIVRPIRSDFAIIITIVGGIDNSFYDYQLFN